MNTPTPQASGDGRTGGPAPRREAVVFLTHLFDRDVARRFAKLRDDCAAGTADAPARDVFLAGEWYTPVPAQLEPLTHRLDFGQVRKRARAVFGDRVVPGNGHLRSLDFADRHPGYARYWFIEYDVVHTGHWGEFLSRFDDDGADLLATHVAAVGDDPGWSWQRRFSTGEDAVDADEWVRAFLPIHRISAAGLEAVARAVGRGWTGHEEIVVPTAIARAGLGLADIGGRGAWTPAERLGRHYLDCRLPDAVARFGTMRWRPPVRWTPVRDMLYHPCKTVSEKRRPPGRRARLRAAVRHPGAVLGYLLRLAAAMVRSRL